MGLASRIRALLGKGPSVPTGAIRDARFVVMDTELTGLEPRKDAIISIGALRMRGIEIEVGGSFQVLVRPNVELGNESVLIHGITHSQVADQPPLDIALSAFQDYLKDEPILVGYCLALDLAFLERGFRKCFNRPFRPPAVDTLSLYAWLKRRHEHPAFSLPPGSLTLFGLSKAFGVPVERGHNALADAYMTAQLFQRLLGLATPLGLESLQDLLRVGNPDSTGDQMIGPEPGAYYG